MLPATLRKSKSKGRSQFAGIGRFARQQRVHRTHAYRVLTGQRHSAKLLAAWKEFQKVA